jgi:hypothetical protein
MGFAQVYFDDFNRADGPNLGADYDNIAGTATGIVSNMAAGMAGSNNLSLVKSATFTGPYDMTTVEADISLTDSSTSLAYVALALGHNGVNATGNGLFIKVQRQGITEFSHIGFYTGVGVNNTAAITGGGGNFVALTTTFSRAHMTVWASDPTTINLGLDTNFDGIDDQVHTRTMVFPTLTVGDRVGLGVFGTTGRADNFQATVVPEPATLAALGLGALALLRKRRKA